MSDTDDHAIIALKNICDFVSTKMLIVMLEMKIPSGECRIAVIQGREDVTMPEQPYIYPFKDGQGYLCLFAYGQENPEYERKLRILLREIIDKSTDKSGIKITAALGVKVKTYRSIRQSYESALKTLEYQFVFGEGNLLDAEEIHAYFGKQDNKLCVDGKEFRDLMDKENREEIKHYILSIFQEYNSKTAVADTFVLKNCALELVILAFQRLDSLSFTESGDIYHMKAEAMKEIENARTLDEILALDPENITVHTLAVKRASRLVDVDKDFHYKQAQTVAEMLKIAKEKLKAAGFRPYYLYRQKHMAGAFENVGYCKDDTPSIYNIRIMEEKQTILALGAGGISKMYYLAENRLERVPNVSNYEIYISRLEEMLDRKEQNIFKEVK